ncbi:SICA-like antigen [Plasmodium coatneyi]|uniref:SICA-like antigen n=1 Tax=Plasmodium coatneyi TaxID=208452 RepID=A0A1B1DT55_9APIC|nr:SICA-like antigen [Plasmodium coatneyi]ANQ05924.1 SICA-like antigen [Plasmodium coatneyi]
MGDFQYFTEFMKKWLTKKGASKTNADVLLKRIEEGVDHMLQNIYQDADLEEKVYCNELDNNNEPILKDEESKELCKILIRIFYWIGGLRQVGKKDEGIWEWIKEVLTDSAEKELQDYLRCIMGKVVIVRMFGNHCRLKKVIPVVKQAINKTVEKKKIKAEHEKCEEMDFKSLKIGGKIFWKEIEDSIMKDEVRGETIKKIIEQGKCEGKNVIKRKQDKNAEEGWKSIAELLRLSSKEELEELITDSETWSKGGLNKILCYMKDKKEIKEVREILVQKHDQLDEQYKKSVKGAKGSEEDRSTVTLSGCETNEEDSSPSSATETFNGGQSTKSPAPADPEKVEQIGEEVLRPSASPKTPEGGSGQSVDTTQEAKPMTPHVDMKGPKVDVNAPKAEDTTPLKSSQTTSSLPGQKGGKGYILFHRFFSSYFLPSFLPYALFVVQYFGLFGRQKRRYKRMAQIPGPPSGAHMDATDLTISYAPYEYILMREGIKPQLTHTTEMQQEEHVNRKTIIDIHLELLNEYQNQNQNEDPELTNRVDFLETIMVEEFMKQESTCNNVQDGPSVITGPSDPDSLGTFS